MGQLVAQPSLTDRMIRAARLDVALYNEVEADLSATNQALTVVVITAVAAGIGAALGLLIKGQPGLAQADAYLLQPYQVGDLVELIEATLINHSPDIICAENMCLDTEQRRLQVNGLVHELRPLASSILALLMQRSGQVVPRDELFRRVWRTTDGDSTRALDVHIAYLRRKLEADPRKPRLIVTERGVGYRLQPPD